MNKNIFSFPFFLVLERSIFYTHESCMTSDSYFDNVYEGGSYERMTQYCLTNFYELCTDKLTIKILHFTHSLSLLAFGLRSKCSICSRRFESRRWFAKNGQALSNGFLDIDRDHPSILGPVSWIISTLQCRRDWSTPVFFGKREPIHIILNLYENFLFLLHHIADRDRE